MNWFKSILKHHHSDKSDFACEVHRVTFPCQLDVSFLDALWCDKGVYLTDLVLVGLSLLGSRVIDDIKGVLDLLLSALQFNLKH